MPQNITTANFICFLRSQLLTNFLEGVHKCNCKQQKAKFVGISVLFTDMNVFLTYESA